MEHKFITLRKDKEFYSLSFDYYKVSNI
jgi:hypothetical protein